MRVSGLIIVIIGIFAANAFAEGKAPEIQVIDNKISIQADAVPLGRLLTLLDSATGLTSKVPSELANRNVSVQFSNLGLDDAVRKIFEALPLDYVVIGGKGIVVTAASQTSPARPATTQPPAAAFTPPAQDGFILDQNQDNPPFGAPQPGTVVTPGQVPTGQAPPVFPNPQPATVQPNAPLPGTAQPTGVFPGAQQPGVTNPTLNQPGVVQTPLGPLANPRATTPVQNGGLPIIQPQTQINPATGLPMTNTPGLPGSATSQPFGVLPGQPTSPTPGQLPGQTTPRQ
jgi:hypothetical protein